MGKLRELAVELVESGLALARQLANDRPKPPVQVRWWAERTGVAVLDRKQVLHPRLDGCPIAGRLRDGLDHVVRVPSQELLGRILAQGHEETRHLRPDGRGPLLPNREPALVLLEGVARHDRNAVVMVDVREERLEPVVVLLGDGIELVVVALRATVGQAKEGGADNGGDVVEHLLAGQQQVFLVALLGVVAVESCGDLGLGARGPDLVPGYLLLHESVVRLVRVER